VGSTDLKKDLARDWSMALGRLKWIFWPVFVAAEVVFLTVQAIYVATDVISSLRFTLNCIIFNVVLISLMLLIYFGFKRMLLRIYESESKVLTIEDISSDAVFTQNTQFEITSWSKGAQRIFGYSPTEAIGASTAIMIPDDVPEVDAGLAERVLEQGIVSQHRTVRRRKNGDLFPAEVSISLLRGPDGQPTGGISVLRDITNQVEMEEKLMLANDELRAYAHVVSHDLKAPLATIKLAAHTLDVLAEDPGDEDSSRRAHEVREALERCVGQSASLIDDMLALAEAGQKPEVISSVDVGDVVEGVVEEMAAYVHDACAKVEVDDQMGTVEASPTHVHQVFANLIGNAIRHNDDETPLVRVLNLGRDGGVQRYMVRDNGSGVPEEDLEKVFVAFFKGRSGDTGIGLSLVQKIVNAYGGEIKVFNDGGACFEFTFGQGG
jgi:PAS domain S-box-containing protein